MTDLSSFVVGQFIGGRAFFFGMALCLLGCSLRTFFSKPRLHSSARITVWAGVVVVVLSAAPFSFWVYGLFFAFLALAAFQPASGLWLGKKTASVFMVLLLGQSLLMICTEVLYSMPPKIRLATGDTLFVVGDSVSIGADRPGKNWPDLLGDLAGLKVRNFSFGGAKVESALDNARRINQDDALVILEIGGNDLLGGTSIPKFRQDLEKMLTLVCGPHRRVAMIELPLPPFYNRYGMVQRALAKSHGVTLIPKHYIAKIMSTPGATVDGLHLNNTGHILLAHALFEMLARPGPGSEAPALLPAQGPQTRGG
jgi:acyl-CoA thioesterase-1